MRLLRMSDIKIYRQLCTVERLCSSLLSTANPSARDHKMKPAMIIVLCIVLFLPLLARSQMESLGRNDTFRAAQLTKKEVEELVRQVQDSAFDTADDWQCELRVRRVDLGSSSGLIIQGTKLLCGGTGNCQTWVFRKLDDRWISLFPGNKVPIIEGFHIGPAATNGIDDFKVVANSGADTDERITYHFDGKYYRPEAKVQ